MLNNKIILDKHNYILLENKRITLVENEYKFWNVFIFIALSIGCYFKIIPFWGYIIITFIILFFSFIKTVTVIDLDQNNIYKFTIMSFFNFRLTKIVIAENLTRKIFMTSVFNTPPNEGSSTTLFVMLIKGVDKKTKENLIQLDNNNGLDLARKIFEQNGLIFE